MEPDVVIPAGPPRDASLADARSGRRCRSASVGNRRLSDEEATRRLSAEGRNELRSKEAAPAWRKMLAQFQDPLIYLLLAAVAICSSHGLSRALTARPSTPS